MVKLLSADRKLLRGRDRRLNQEGPLSIVKGIGLENGSLVEDSTPCEYGEAFL